MNINIFSKIYQKDVGPFKIWDLTYIESNHKLFFIFTNNLANKPV